VQKWYRFVRGNAPIAKLMLPWLARRRRFAIHILQSHLTVCYQSAAVVSDVDAPQLLGPTLMKRYRFNVDAPARQRSQKMAGVGKPDRHLTLIPHGHAGSNRSGALDGRRVHATVNYSPRCVVCGVDIKMGRNAAITNLVEHQPSGPDKGAARVKRTGVQPWPGCDRCRRV
jgi:hypothetical protein